MEYFDYIGCLNEVSVHSYNTEMCGSPGQCFRECGYGLFFGLMALKCFCFKKNPMSSHASPVDSNCNRTCNSQPEVGCGGPGFISVYKFNSHARQKLSELNKNANQTNMFCLQVDPANLQYSWSNCSESLTVICDFDGTSIIITIPPENQPWIVSANDCFSQQAGYKANIIRYGILTRRNNRFILTFMEHSSDRKVLCFNDSKGPDVGIIVGVSVAAVLLVTALIGVFAFLRRRKNISDLCLKLETTKQSNNTNQSIPTYANVVMPTSGETSNSNYAHTYSALAPQDNVSQTYDILAHASGH